MIRQPSFKGYLGAPGTNIYQHKITRITRSPDLEPTYVKNTKMGISTQSNYDLNETARNKAISQYFSAAPTTFGVHNTYHRLYLEFRKTVNS